MHHTESRISQRARLGGAALGLTLLLGGSLLASARPAAADTQDISGGSLDWGIKESFRSYVSGNIGHGSYTAGDGATVTGGDTFLFEPASGSYDPATGNMEAAFGSGYVHFEAHDFGGGPFLDVTITDLRISLTNGTAVIIADVDSRDLLSMDPNSDPGPLVNYDDVEIATLDFTGLAPSINGATVTFTNVPVALTAAGAPAFANIYDEGTELDPLTFSVTLAAPETPTATPETPTATATPETPAATATPTTPAATATPTQPAAAPQITVSKTEVNPAGDTITVTGTGFLPSLATGARPPLAGKPAGVYVAFASFAEVWQPSAGAPSSARPTMPQDSGGLKWAVLEADRETIGQAASVTLNEDGSFTAVLTIAKDYPNADPGGRYGIYTYAGSGAVAPIYETFTPLTFSAEPTATAVPATPTSVPPTAAPATATPTRVVPGAPSTGTGSAGSPLSGGLMITLAGALLVAGAGAFTVLSKRTKTNR